MPDTSQQIFEFRGVDNFYFAEVIEDDSTAYSCGTPVHIPVQEVGKTTDSSSEAHYYDNKAMIVVNSESADTITLTLAPPALDKLAQLTGKSFDATTGTMIDSPRQNKYFAIMYRTKGTDGGYRYVSRLKGQFNIPEETVQTENDGTDTTNTQIEFTGIYTEHEFTKGIYDGTQWQKSGVKGIVVDARYGLADVSDFFSQVQTPDTIQVVTPAQIPSVTLNQNTASITVGGSSLMLTATVVPSGTAVTFTSSNDDVATVTTVGADGRVEAVAAGEATITASITVDGQTYTDTCTVTVTGD